MITTSKEANPNYLCKIVQLKGVRKHTNADRLQCVDIDFQTVITGLDAKDGDIYVYFPLESKINSDFLSFTNSFRDKELNSNKEKAGFFDTNSRVRAMKLRGEKSMGYVVPVEEVLMWAYGDTLFSDDIIGRSFDTINGKKLVEKYMVKKRESNKASKQGKKPRISRLVDGQVHLHTDTENLRRNVHKLQLNDTISITYKTHGTSWWVSNVLVKRKLSFMEKILQRLGVRIEDTEYDIVYGSRRVVKNEYLDDSKKHDHYFSYDLWKDIKDSVADLIPKGYTLYGEALGYDKNGGYIQKDYDYGCQQGEMKLEVYRITHTTPDGLVTELSHPEIEEFCDRTGLTASTLFYYGSIRSRTEGEYYDYRDDWREWFIRDLEGMYNEKDCFMCFNTVPEEGVVIRKESLFNFEAYKLKSFRFLEKETKDLDNGESDIESEN